MLQGNWLMCKDQFALAFCSSYSGCEPDDMDPDKNYASVCQALLQSQLNQERVNFRQTEAATKEQLRAEKAAMLLCEEQQRTARLDRLRAQVTYCMQA